MKKSIKTYALLAMTAAAITFGAVATVATPKAYAEGEGGGAAASEDEEIVVTGRDADVALTQVSAPASKYGESAPISFTAKVKGGSIQAIYPVVSSDFPFDTNDAAYKITEGTPTAETLAVSYNFTVRRDVTSGYHAVNFVVEYTKGGKEYTVIKTINVSLEAEPVTTEELTTEASSDVKYSTPRVIVTGYEIDQEQVYAGENFKITLHLQNTSKRAISNMKVTMESAAGEFVSASGSSTRYVQSLGAGETVNLEAELTALATLEPKPYTLTVHCDYEDGMVNPYESSDNVSIPVLQRAKIKISDISCSPDMITIDSDGNVSVTINNLGRSALTSLSARIESKYMDCEDCYVGNIAAGASAYADITVYGKAISEGPSKLVLTYEDAAGKEQTYEEDIEIEVGEGGFIEEGEFEPDPEEFDEHPVRTKVIHAAIIAAIVIVVIAAAVVVTVILVKKKKSKAEKEELEELDDDDDDLEPLMEDEKE